MKWVTAGVVAGWMMCAQAAPVRQIPPEFHGYWIDARHDCRQDEAGDYWRQIDARNILQHEQHCRFVRGVQADARTVQLQVLCTEEDSQIVRQSLRLTRSADGRRLRLGGQYLRRCDRKAP